MFYNLLPTCHLSVPWKHPWAWSSFSALIAFWRVVAFIAFMVVLCWRENKVKRTGQRKKEKTWQKILYCGVFRRNISGSVNTKWPCTWTEHNYKWNIFIIFNSCFKNILSFTEGLLFGGRNERTWIRMIFNNIDEPERHYATYEISQSQRANTAKFHLYEVSNTGKLNRSRK